MPLFANVQRLRLPVRLLTVLAATAVLMGVVAPPAVAQPPAPAHLDASGNGHVGLDDNPVFGPGRFGEARVFDGVSDHVRVAHNGSALGFAGSFTIEAWVLSENNGGNNRIVSKDTTGELGTFILWRRQIDDRLHFLVIDDNDGIYRTTGSVLPTGVWQHVVGVFDGAAQRVRLYENGGLVDDIMGPAAVKSHPGNDVVIGGSNDVAHLWTGAIDEVRIYDRALTPLEIRQSYESGITFDDQDLKLRFSLDVADFSVPAHHQDLSGNGFAGLDSDPEFGPGQSGEARLFDGTSDHVRAAGSGSGLDTTGSFTVEAWVSSENASGNNRIVSKDTTGEFGTFIFWRRQIDDRLHFLVIDDNDVAYRTTGSVVPLSTWIHVAGVYDATAQRVRLYENGLLVDDIPGPAAVKSSPGDDVVIGASNDVEHLWAGAVDEVRIYERALLPIEILQSFQNGTVVGDGSLRLRYSFDVADFSAVVPASSSLVDFRTPDHADPNELLADTLPIRGLVRDDPELQDFGYEWNGAQVELYDADTKVLLSFAGPVTDPGGIVTFADATGNGFDAVSSDPVDQALDRFNTDRIAAAMGRWGTGLSFDGVDDHVSLPGSGTGLDGTGSFTVQAWVNMDSPNFFGGLPFFPQPARILAKDRTGVIGKFILWRFEDRIQFLVADQNLTWYRAKGDDLKPGLWTHVVGVFDAANARVQLYQNGELTADIAGPTAANSNPDIDVTIGASFDGAHHWLGGIDEVRFIDRALSANEVATHYRSNVTKTGGDWTFTALEEVVGPSTYSLYANYANQQQTASRTIVNPAPGDPDLTVWLIGDPHIQTSLSVGHRSLEATLRDSLGTEAPLTWDLSVVTGDYKGGQGLPDDMDGMQLAEQYTWIDENGVLVEIDPNLFYGVIGNHDAGLNDAAWFEKWVDPLGENTQFSGIDNTLRPFPVSGAWDHYAFQAGNVLFLMLGDKNFGGPPFGREATGGYPAGRMTAETYHWWQDMVEANQDKIIVTMAHHTLFETSIYTAFGESNNQRLHGTHSWADEKAGGIIYAIDNLTIDGLDENQVFQQDPEFGFKMYLEQNPGAIDFWLYGHTHHRLFPGKTFNGRADIEHKHGATFINAGAIFKGPQGMPAINFTRVLEFENGSNLAKIKTYLHNTDLNGEKGFYDLEEKTIHLRMPFVE